MGLDMFLIGLKSKRDPGDPVGSNHGIYEECCYWRKANAIHNWFSKRYIREGNPWGYYSVPVHELEGLLVLCKHLKHIKESCMPEAYLPESSLFYKFEDEELKQITDFGVRSLDAGDYIALAILPPNNVGCFFGSGAVDEDYWDHIDSTIEQLEEAFSKDYDEYIYYASW